MKMVFICGSVEPGKDGVGDYTRRLSAQLLKQEINVAVLSYNDKFVDEPKEELQNAEGENLLCYRLPKKFNASLRCELAKTWVNKQNPEWLSLQFVPYAFHNKGLPLGLAKQLLNIAQGKKWHIMCHELWIGMSKQSPKKDLIVGGIQKYIINHLIKKLQPKILHTQTQLYQKYLNSMRFEAKRLPLFSNIPVSVSKNQSSQTLKKCPEKFFVLFGGIHPGAPIQDFVNELMKIPKFNNYALLTIGRNGSELQKWNEAWTKAGFEVLNLGEQENPAIISQVLAKASYGLSTTPIALIEKSGALAAKQIHGLPVICLSKAWTPRQVKVNWEIKGVLNYQKGNLKTQLEIDDKLYPVQNGVKNMSNIFLNQINKSS